MSSPNVPPPYDPASGASLPPEGVTFPRLMARTQRFTLGAPTTWTVAPDGKRVLFLRTISGTDRTGVLWRLDIADGRETEVAHPHALLPGDAEDSPAAERARRERMRQSGAGITAYSTDRDCGRAVVALAGRVFVVAVGDGSAVEIATAGPAVDPRLSPDGEWVAYHCDGGLHVAPATGSSTGRALVASDEPSVTWGLSDFAHAEELARMRSFWWAPDGESLLVARVDAAPVQEISMADPAQPTQPAMSMRYPFAGSANVRTSLWHIRLDGSRDEIMAEREVDEYLVDVTWRPGRPALISVLDRDQRRWRVLSWEPSRHPVLVRDVRDPSWVDVVAGAPTWWGERLVTVEVDEQSDTARVCLNGVPASPPGMQVQAILAVEDAAVLVAVSEHERERRVARMGADGSWSMLTPAGCLGTAQAAGETVVTRLDPRDAVVPTVTVSTPQATHPMAVHVVAPDVTPAPMFLPRADASDPRVAVLLPSVPHPAPLPVLLDPYGGPHGQRVVDAARAYLESQWWADQGFAVVVAEGPGTPGSPRWQRAMSGEVAGPALTAQVRALEMVSKALGAQVDLARVAIRGWSFGGYLAALAVLDRPDVVHAAIAGAPVTDWALYDTAYTERYLGLPQEHPGRYAEQSLLDRAASLRRPLMIVHGLADDNVLVAHSLRLSSALLAAGRSHRFLPLTGVTHMASQEEVTENLLLAQREFLREALAPLPAPPAPQ